MRRSISSAGFRSYVVAWEEFRIKIEMWLLTWGLTAFARERWHNKKNPRTKLFLTLNRKGEQERMYRHEYRWQSPRTKLQKRTESKINCPGVVNWIVVRTQAKERWLIEKMRLRRANLNFGHHSTFHTDSGHRWWMMIFLSCCTAPQPGGVEGS